MIFVAYNSNTTEVTSGAGTTNLSSTCVQPPVFIWLRVVQSLVLYIVFSRSLFVLLSFFLCPLYCFSFFDWRLLSPLGIIKPFVSGFVWESNIYVFVFGLYFSLYWCRNFVAGVFLYSPVPSVLDTLCVCPA